VNREAIHLALFALLGEIEGIKTLSRRLQHWSDVPGLEQPALFQSQRGQTAHQHAGVPPKWTLEVDLFLYVNSGNDPKAVPAIVANGLLDAIEAALAPVEFGGKQTLGGLVEHCWISGRIETDEGVLGPQAVAIIPIEILAA
jgi:hypothetical protein